MIRPPPGLHHLARGALQAEEHALGVDPVDAVPIRLGQVHDVGVAGHPGIVDDDVEAAQFGDRARDHRIDARDIAAIGLDRNRPPHIPGRVVGGPLRRGKVDVGGRDSGADFRHRERDGAPDPRPRPRHQHDFILQNRHVLPPAFRQTCTSYIPPKRAALIVRFPV